MSARLSTLMLLGMIAQSSVQGYYGSNRDRMSSLVFTFCCASVTPGIGIFTGQVIIIFNKSSGVKDTLFFNGPQ